MPCPLSRLLVLHARGAEENQGAVVLLEKAGDFGGMAGLRRAGGRRIGGTGVRRVRHIAMTGEGTGFAIWQGKNADVPGRARRRLEYGACGMVLV